MQQLAIRLNIPGFSSRHLPSEPREGMGPELPGPAQGLPRPQAPLRWTGQRAGREGGDRDGSLDPVPNRVRPPPRDSPNPGSGTPERRWWDSRENPRVDVLTFPKLGRPALGTAHHTLLQSETEDLRPGLLSGRRLLVPRPLSKGGKRKWAWSRGTRRSSRKMALVTWQPERL